MGQSVIGGFEGLRDGAWDGSGVGSKADGRKFGGSVEGGFDGSGTALRDGRFEGSKVVGLYVGRMVEGRLECSDVGFWKGALERFLLNEYEVGLFFCRDDGLNDGIMLECEDVKDGTSLGPLVGVSIGLDGFDVGWTVEIGDTVGRRVLCDGCGVGTSLGR